jgi:hypothetical protein
VIERLGIVLEITVIVRQSCGLPSWAYWIDTWNYCLTDASHPVLASETLSWFLRAKSVPIPMPDSL